MQWEWGRSESEGCQSGITLSIGTLVVSKAGWVELRFESDCLKHKARRQSSSVLCAWRLLFYSVLCAFGLQSLSKRHHFTYCYPKWRCFDKASAKKKLKCQTHLNHLNRDRFNRFKQVLTDLSILAPVFGRPILELNRID